jgi:hypothetical protein
VKGGGQNGDLSLVLAAAVAASHARARRAVAIDPVRTLRAIDVLSHVIS